MLNLGRWLHYLIHEGREPIRRQPRPRRNPPPDYRYRAFVRSHPCCVCGSPLVEFAHTGPHGLGQKAPDKDGIPLCFDHHQGGPRALHKLGPAAFQKYFGIRIRDVIEELRAEWREILVSRGSYAD